MVLRWGMSDKVGNIDYAEAHEGYQGNTAGLSVSASTKELIEEEVRNFIQQGYERARDIILEKNEEFERLAQGLLEYETLTGEEIKRVMAGEPPHVGDDADDTPPSGGTPSVTAIPKTKPKKPTGYRQMAGWSLNPQSNPLKMPPQRAAFCLRPYVSFGVALAMNASKKRSTSS